GMVVLLVEPPAGEDPHAPGERQLRVAPQHQGLDAAVARADHDHGGRGHQHRRLAGLGALALLGPGAEAALVGHGVTSRAPAVPASISKVASTDAVDVGSLAVSTTTYSLVHFSGVTVHRT